MEEPKSFGTFIKKHYMLSTIVIGVVVVVALGALGSNNSSSSPSTSNADEAQTAAPQTPAQQVCAMTPQQLRSQAQTVSYAQLVKDPDSFQGTITKFTGQILQIEQSGDTGVLRLSVTNLGYGVWSPNDVVYVEYNQATGHVQGDVVTVYGMLNGTQTYTSEANYQITLPDLVACAIGAIPAPASSSTSANTSSATQSASAQAATAPAQTQTPTPTPTYTTPSGAVVDQSGNVVSQGTGAPAPAQPAAPPATWHTAYTYSGSSNTNTQTFALQGQQQKIEYQCTVPESSDQETAWFNGTIQGTNGGGYDVFAYTVTCPTSNTTYEYSLSPGQYYLGLQPFNASYSVTVLDYY